MKGIKLLYRFCSINPMAPMSLPKRDYEYSNDIQYQITNARPLQGYNLLIESYLRGTLLDVQTYYLVYKALAECSIDVSYLIVMYCMYRDQFKPMPIMLEIMEALIQEKQVRQMVLEDYKYLNVKPPLGRRKKMADRLKRVKQMVEQEIKFKHPQRSELLKKIYQSQSSGDIQFFRNQFKILIQAFLQHHGISIHDYQVNFGEDEPTIDNDYNDFDANNPDQFGNINQPHPEENQSTSAFPYNLNGSYLKSIKIGRISISKKKKS